MKQYALVLSLLLVGCKATENKQTDDVVVTETVQEVVEEVVEVEALPTSLTIETAPTDARVRIMNIKPVYYDGIELAEGKYDVLVTKPGYKPKRMWIEVNKATFAEVELAESDSSDESVMTVF